MAYSFDCTNVVPGCPGQVEGDTVDEVLARVAEHARNAHGIHEVDDQLAAAVRAGIRTS